MNSQLQPIFIDTLRYLMKLTQENIQPKEAQTGLHLLRKQHPDTKVELVWEEEAYTQSIHYDALLQLPNEGTVSLSFCPDNALPWPLRGVHRWSEKDLVRVNNTVLKVAQAMACLDFIWDEVPIISRLVNVCLIQEALEQEPIELSDEELQWTMDGFRRAHKLYTVADTIHWIEQRGMTYEQLEQYVTDEATVAKLRERVTHGRVEEYFAVHQDDFAGAYIARIDFADEASAAHWIEQIRTGAVDFYQVAERSLLTAEHVKHALPNLLSAIQRGQTPVELRTAIFAAAPGAILGPLPLGEGYSIIRVLSFTDACLDEPTCNAIKKMLFEEWLTERRQAANIEWYWGNASRTAQNSENL